VIPAADELSLALNHYNAREFAEAERICRQILEREPANARVLYLCAAAVAQMRRLNDSIDLLRRTTAADATFTDAWDDLARLYDATRRFAEAAECLQRVAESKPSDVGVLIRWSSALLNADRPAAAQSVADRAVKLQPDSPEAHFNLACALEHQSRLDDAIAEYRKVVALRPGFVMGHVNLGAALHQQGHLEAAEEALAHALKADPNSALALSNRAMILAELDRLDESEPMARRAVELQPGNSTFATNLATVLGRLHRYDEAVPIAERATQLDPANHFAHTAAGMLLLTVGRWREAWPHWEQRTHGWDAQPTGRATWDGSSLNGRSIVVRAEQGFGDTIQCLRFVPLLKSERGAGRVMIECQRPLKELLMTVPGVDEVHVKQESTAPAETEVWVMSLPRWFDATPESIPGSVPFLTADAARVERLRPKVATTTGLKVGFVWAGSPTYRADRARSCPIDELKPLAQLPGVTCFSLQRGAAQQRDATAAKELGLIDLAAEFRDITDLAAGISLLDLLITVDTSAAHLAGAMARPVWTMLSDMADWRYRAQAERTAWYPTMHLFRQSSPGDWAGVIARVADSLRDMIGGLRPTGP
jgi:tetratricopeptide (TPR) repeat protein